MNAVPAPYSTPAPGRSTVAHCRSVAEIEAVFDPHVNLVVWTRQDAACEARARAWSTTPGRVMRTLPVRSLSTDEIAEQLALDQKGPLVADILMLCELFATITGADTLGLRTDITERATCPNFHTDNVTLRLMTTYRGPATEWLEGEQVHSAKRGDVLLAKGANWPDLACAPCPHRSPLPRAGETRVLLTLDAL